MVAVVPAPHRGAPPSTTPAPVSNATPDTTPPPASQDDRGPEDSGGAQRRPPASPELSDASPCERSCAELYTCVIEEGDNGPAAAASIELGCLEACVQAPVLGSLFGCELPSPPVRCPPFLACVRDAWPEQHSDAAPPRVIDPVGSGCERACWAFARCEGTEADTDGVRSCIHKCGDVLDDAQERFAGECSDLPTCDELQACVRTLPGAA